MNPRESNEFKRITNPTESYDLSAETPLRVAKVEISPGVKSFLVCQNPQ